MWSPIADFVRVIGFEPVTEKCRELQRRYPGNLYFDTGLWKEKGEVPFYLTPSTVYASILKPNIENFRLIGKQDAVEAFTVERIAVNRLDDVLAPHQDVKVDFIDIDTQGTELPILEHGVKTITNAVLGAFIEVEFIELYHEQPLFADVDRFMTTHGFDFTAFLNMSFWRSDKARMFANPQARFLSGNALYLRSDDISTQTKVQTEQMLKLVVIECVFGFPDLALRRLETFGACLEPGLRKRLETILVGMLRAHKILRFRGKERLVRFFWWLIKRLDERPYMRIQNLGG